MVSIPLLPRVFQNESLPPLWSATCEAGFGHVSIASSQGIPSWLHVHFSVVAGSLRSPHSAASHRHWLPDFASRQ